VDRGKENEKIIYFFLHFLFPVHVSFPERKRTEERGENKKENIFSTSFFCFFLSLSFPAMKARERKGKCVGESLKKVSTSETTPNDTSKEREREWLGEKQTCAQPIPFPFLLFFGLTARKKRGRSVRLASYFLFFFLLASHTPSRERETGDRRQETDLRSGA